MENRSIGDWMRSFHYGRPITSRTARTAAGYYRAVVGVLVLGLFATHLIYLLFSSPVRWPLVTYLLVASAIYLGYVVVRMHIPALHEAKYYDSIIQHIRAQLGIWGTAILLFAFARSNQPNLFWPLFLLPIMIVSEHCSTNTLLRVLFEVALILLGATWLESHQSLMPFLTGSGAFIGVSRGLIMALFGFLIHYTMRNLDARDQTIAHLRNLLVFISKRLPSHRDPRSMRQTALEVFIETVDAQCGALWVASRDPDVLRAEASLCRINGQMKPVCLGSTDGSIHIDAATEQDSLPVRVMRTDKPHCISRSGDVPAALTNASLNSQPLFPRASVEIGLPVKIFQLHKPESVAVLTLDFGRPMGKDELRRVYLTAVEIAAVLSPVFYFASLTEELHALRHLGHAVSSSLERAPVIETLLSILTDTLGFDFALVWLVDEIKETINVKKATQLDGAWPEEKAFYPQDGDTVQAEVVRTGETRFLTDLDDRVGREVWSRFDYPEMMRICIPMAVADQETGAPKRIGVVEVGYWHGNQDQTEAAQIELLEPFVTQAAVAVNKAQLYGQARWRADALERLHDVGNAIQGAVWKLSRLMQEIGESALAVLNADIIFLYGYDEKAHSVEMLHQAGEIRGEGTLSLRLGEGNILDWIIDHRRPFYTCDAQNEPQLVGYDPSKGQVAKYRTFTQRQRVQAFAGIPLLAGERLIGIMCVNYREPQRFSPEVEHIVELFAQLAAVALENYRLKELDKELALQRERNHLSRELHDALVQDLYGIALKLGTWLQSIDDAPTAKTDLQQLVQLAEGAKAQIGYLVAELRAPLLSRRDFRETLRDTADRIGQFYGLEVTHQCDGIGPIEVPSLANTALAHVAKEAMTNAVRHARAKCISVRCWKETSKQILCLEVEDDGIGFDPNKRPPNKQGLKNMREFAQEANSYLEIDTGPGSGTCIRLTVPLEECH